MEFDGEILKLDCKNPVDRYVMSDLVLAFARTVHDGSSLPTYPELQMLGRRIYDATPANFRSRKPRPILELDIDEIQVCAGLINPAMKTHINARLPLESMEKTRDFLFGLLEPKAD